MTAKFKVEFLLPGDLTVDGIVADTHGQGGEVIVDYQDGTSKRYQRGTLIEVTK